MEADEFSDLSLSDADSVDEDLPDMLPADWEGCGVMDDLDYAETIIDPTEFDEGEEDPFEAYDVRP